MRNANSIYVPLRLAEDALRLLRKMNLVDIQLKLKRSDEALAIPLVREPSAQELSRLKGQCKDMNLQKNVFDEALGRPRDLREIVEERIPMSLIRNLPRSFDVIGDIAVVDLPRELSEFSQLIADGILKINPRIRLVLKKSSEISGTYRTRKFETIVGSGRTETIYREFSCQFRLDVTSVYFNPRLSHERMRVAKQVEEGEMVVDMFAGVGPYSILIAKQQPNSRIHSIDLNPEAVRYLRENVLLNKVADRVIPVLGDIRELATGELRRIANRVIMNLPGDAKTFLKTALQILKDQGVVHYYSFESRNQSLANIEHSFRSSVEAAGGKVRSFNFAKIIKEVAPGRVQVVLDAIVQA